jgi:hypothetical protein
MPDNFQQHPDDDVRQALIRLCDALCTWERSTGRTSVLVLRGSDGFQFRAESGKPLDSTTDDISDEQLFQILSADEGSF